MSAPSTLTLRLKSAREAIQEATRQALRSVNTEETLSGVMVPGGRVEGFSLDSPRSVNDDRYSAGFDKLESATGDPADDGDGGDGGDGREGDHCDGEEEEAMSREGFDLGMSLFGEDVGAIEREISIRLGRVEEELRDIARAEREQVGRSAVLGAASNNRDEGESGGIDEESAVIEARTLVVKAGFLRKCSEARAALDEAEALAISSATGASMESVGGRSSLVDSARLLSQADGALREAERGLPTESLGPIERAKALRILDSIRSQVRNKMVDLQVRSAAVLDTCIVVAADGIHVGMGKGRKSGDGLADAYDALSLLSLPPADNASPRKTSNDGLDDAIFALSNNVYDLVLKPMLESLKNAIRKGVMPRKYEFRETSSDRGADGPYLKLGWMQDGENVARLTRATATPSSAKEVIRAWGDFLGSIKTVLGFVHEHILLKRPELCLLMGRYIIGDATESAASRSSVNLPNSLDLGGVGKLSLSLSDERFGRLMNDMVSAMWEICLPSKTSDEVLSNLHTLGRTMQSQAMEFEQEMNQIGLLQLEAGDSERKNTPLVDFATTFERHFAEKRRTLILAQGRELLLRGDYHNTIDVGKDIYANRGPVSDSPLHFDEGDDGMDIFELHKCTISKVASDLMQLIRETMDAAVDPRYFLQDIEQSEADALTPLPPTLYRTARELLDLFRAVIPSVHGNEVSTVPRTAAVLHNDCVYFAHEMLTFGLEYREKFPDNKGEDRAAALRRLCTFVDLVPPFRERADRTMVDTIERQKGQLADIVQSRISILREALRSNEGVVEWTDAETALTAGTYHLGHLSNAWRSILSRDVYGRAMGNLVDTVLSLFLDQVMTARDISEPASHFVGALFRDALRRMADLFSHYSGSFGSGDGMGATPNPEGDTVVARRFCSLWGRFVAVGKFMDMTLLDINTALSTGVFQDVTGSELTRLIKAAFDDSDRRMEVLKALAPDTSQKV